MRPINFNARVITQAIEVLEQPIYGPSSHRNVEQTCLQTGTCLESIKEKFTQKKGTKPETRSGEEIINIMLHE